MLEVQTSDHHNSRENTGAWGRGGIMKSEKKYLNSPTFRLFVSLCEWCAPGRFRCWFPGFSLGDVNPFQFFVGMMSEVQWNVRINVWCCIFSYIANKHQLNVGDIPYIDPMGWVVDRSFYFFQVTRLLWQYNVPRCEFFLWQSGSKDGLYMYVVVKCEYKMMNINTLWI